ncbi:MAG TPA: heme exporter protein CcmB [Ideonella sp.]|jgi:heme exporter protein B|nr:heme exporter protein CcmB [Ideonella sp.]
MSDFASSGAPTLSASTASRSASAGDARLGLLARDLRVAARHRVDWLLPLAFFVAALSLFPLGLGAETALLRRVAPGVVWACALLSMLLAVHGMFSADLADGSLEQMLIGQRSLTRLVAERVLAQWLLGGAPLVLLAPLAGLAFGLSGPAVGVLVVSLLLGTPVMALLGAFGAALALGLRHGSALVFLLVLPLAMPTLVFGSGAVLAALAGEPVEAALSLQGALLILTALGAPPLTAAALRIALE